MILTVNLNAALDHVIFVEDLNQRGMIRATKSIQCIGGKGADTALALAQLGAPHRLLSFNAGKNGETLKELYKQHEIQSQLVEVSGETRIVTVIIETVQKKFTQISQSGYCITEQDGKFFIDALKENLTQANWCIAAGSLPQGASPDVYRIICEQSHMADAKILIDVAGEPLLSALPAHPDIVKLNRREFQTTFQGAFSSIESLVNHARNLIKEYSLKMVMITLGSEGILLINENDAFHAKGPLLEPINSAGAGDAASAAFVYQLFQGQSLENALMMACATSAAVVLSEGTAEFSLQTMNSLLPKIQLSKIYQGAILSNTDNNIANF